MNDSATGVEKFSLGDVPEFGRDEAKSHARLAAQLPDQSAAARIRESLESAILHLPAPKGAGAERIGELEIVQHGIASRCDDPLVSGARVRFFFRTAATDRGAFLDTSLSSARALVGNIVGVSGDKLAESDLLTNLESGVLGFFAERLIAGVTEGAPYVEALLPIALDAVGCENSDPEWGEGGMESWYAVCGQAKLADVKLSWRLLLPIDALGRCSLRYSESPAAADEAEGAMALLRRSLGHTRVDLTGRVGEVHLSAGDVDRLERNDIILFESEGLDLTSGSGGGFALAPGATIRLAPTGRGAGSGSLVATVVSDDGKVEVKVEEFADGPEHGEEQESAMTQDEPMNDEPTEDAPDDTEGGEKGTGEDGAEDTSPGEQFADQGKAMTEEIPVVLRVEIGRARMTLRELAKLGEGSIVELGKDSSAPVSLVVEDRVMGRGELVKVEGDLGVRILSLG